ncbi:hypothetical protein E1212_04360 [Jiangella ureilytica]|uniref:LapA family protein n=1 Tax=Jiangella ureilytica TaxID=2530374 RepID=A0A4R4RVJ2_9ACTN|nr:hypothetical protein [Jiangella ureilytica]TDC53724.1 hypothetical protein E1212_04360 [Jiangella ureilytica]
MMIVLALLLLAVAGVAVYVIAMDGTGQMMIDEFGLNTEVPIWAVFVAGAVTMFVVVAAVAAFASGMRAARARRTEIRYLRQKVATQETAEDHAVADRSTTDGAPAGRTTDDTVADDGQHHRLGRWRRRHAADDTRTDKPPAEATRS